MKKSFSLLLSLILAFSMCLGSINIAWASEPGDTLVQVFFDTTGRAYADYNSQISEYIGVNYMEKGAYADDSTAFQFLSNRQDRTMRFTLASPNVNDANPTAGIYTLSGKMLGNKAKSDGSIDFSASKVQLNRTSSGNTAYATPAGLTANTWLDFAYIVDLDNGNFTVKYRNPADEAGVYEFESTDSFTAGTAFNELYFQLLYNEGTSILAFKDLKYTVSTGAGVAQILSVNNGEEVQARTKNLSFVISEEISGLEAGHITATPSNGGAAIAANTINVTEGDNCYVINATFAQRFTENLTYDLAISASAYAGYKQQSADGTISDVDVSGLTAQFTTGDYTIDPTGTGKLVKTVFDTTGKDVSVVYRAPNTDYNYTMKYTENGVTTNVNGLRFGNKSVLDIVTIGDESVAAYHGAKADGSTGDYYTSWYFTNEAISAPPALTSGVYKFTGRIYSTTDEFSQFKFIFHRNQGTQAVLEPVNASNKIKAKTWYTFELTVDLDADVVADPSYKNLKVVLTEESQPQSGEKHVLSDETTFKGALLASFRGDIDLSSGLYADYVAYDDVKLEAYIDKANILSVNSDAYVAPNQKELTFTMSGTIPGVTENPNLIYAEDASGNENTAASVAVNGNVVTVNFTENLTAWSDYTLYISTDAYSGYSELNIAGDLLDPVTDTGLSKAFSVASTGFDMREKSITESNGTVTYVMEYTNSSSSCTPITVLIPVYSADGVMQKIEVKNLTDLPINDATKELTATATLANGEYVKLFAVNGLDGKVPYYGRSWNVNAPAQELQTYSSAEAITLGDFDYKTFTFNVGVDTGVDAEVGGILYVYDSSAPSGTPIFADYITTNNDGTFSKDITLKLGSTRQTVTYEVGFYPASPVSPVTAQFICYSEDDILNQRRQVIFEAAKKATTVGTLKQVIYGTDANEVVINDNFEVFSKGKNFDKFNKINNKTNVFVKMLPKVSSLANYNALVKLFEDCAYEIYQTENSKPSSPSSDNKSYGSSSVALRENVTASAVNNNPAQSGQVASFVDMKGHWAEEFASKLNRRGIMNGYGNNDFRGENSITRAELAKTIIQALDLGTAQGAIFADVAADAWYAPYIAGASIIGVINGFEDGTFGPDKAVTRQDAVLMLYRAMSVNNELPVGFTFFKDDLNISDYASQATRCLGDLKIINGDTKGNFNPANEITRAEVAAIICRALDYIESH